MRVTEPSRTSKLAALSRGEHRLRHSRPWVIDDQLAYALVGPGWGELIDTLGPLFPDAVMDGEIAWQVARARYAEERLSSADFDQYVILGAGLDSFAWRRPDALARLTVYEIDHPATQAWKQERRDVLALPKSERHVFAPVDFETQSLREGLDAAGFDWSMPTLFSWLGVVMYLTPEAISATLQTIASAAAGSQAVIHYVLDAAHRDDLGSTFLQIMDAIAAQSGEPLVSFWTPEEAEALMADCGLDVVDHPSRDELVTRYFAGRDDGLAPFQAEAILTAAVPTPKRRAPA